MNNAHGCRAGLGSVRGLSLDTFAARPIVIGQDHNIPACKKLGPVLGQITSAAERESGEIALAERIGVFFAVWPTNPITGQLGVERINHADIRNARIAVRFSRLPTGLAIVAHAIPIDESRVIALGSAFDFDPNGRAVALVDMPADFVVTPRRPVIAPREKTGLAVCSGRRAAPRACGSFGDRLSPLE